MRITHRDHARGDVAIGGSQTIASQRRGRLGGRDKTDGRSIGRPRQCFFHTVDQAELHRRSTANFLQQAERIGIGFQIRWEFIADQTDSFRFNQDAKSRCVDDRCFDLP